jgi:elongation factor G
MKVGGHPDDYTAAVTGDLSSRRGHLESQVSPGGPRSSRPTSRCRTCVRLLDRSGRGRGRATYTMHFEKYAEAPRNVSEEVVAKVMGKAAKA